MEIMEIVLLVAGGIIFVLSFLIPDRKGSSGGLGPSAEREVRELVDRELETLRSHVDEIVEESIADAMEGAERSMERLSNEKIMAVNEYSDTVLKEIHKNHEEAVFLYDMLNNKHTSLKNTAAEVSSTIKEAEEAIQNLQKLTVEIPARTVMQPEEPFVWEQSGEAQPEAESQWGELTAGQESEEGTDEGGPEHGNNEKILKLYKKGKSAVAIARELELGIGEVRLVIDLYRNQT